MICQLGESTVSLSEQDVMIAIQDFLNKAIFNEKPNKVNSMVIHRKGSKKAITVEVSK